MDRLQAMRIFARVAELGSFTRAANDLGLSRARASEAIVELERALGAKLLHRTTRKVSLSDDGRVYYERVRQILADVDEAEARVGGSEAAHRGVLRLAMPMALARAYVVPKLPGFLARHRGLSLEVRLENRSLGLLEEGLDCALSYGKPSDESLVARSVMKTHLLTAAAPSYLARRGVPRTPAELERHDCVGFLAPSSARPAPFLFSSGGESRELRPRGSVAFNSMEACLEAAIAGLGVTQVLSVLAAPALRQKQLRPLLAQHAASGPDIYVVYPPQRQGSARLRTLMGFLTRALSAATT